MKTLISLSYNIYRSIVPLPIGGSFNKNRRSVEKKIINHVYSKKLTAEEREAEFKRIGFTYVVKTPTTFSKIVDKIKDIIDDEEDKYMNRLYASAKS